MKISASIYSTDDCPLVDLVRELDKFDVEYLHVDCKDDPSVFDDVKELRAHTSTGMDLHLITSRPEVFMPLLVEYEIEIASFQYENLKGPLEVPDNLRTSLGLAISADTPVEVFDEFAEICSFVLFMTTIPGESGGTFNRNTFRRIREFRRRYPRKRVHVDGGVDDRVSFILRNMGVYCAVSGSYLVRALNIPGALWRLRGVPSEDSWTAEDFMILPNELPIVAISACDIEAILRKMGDYRLGFCLIVDDEHRLVGVVSDGDVRRSVLRWVKERVELDVSSLINENPITLPHRSSVDDMFKVVREHSRTILFLPVTDDRGHLLGAVTFGGLAKGEL